MVVYNPLFEHLFGPVAWSLSGTQPLKLRRSVGLEGAALHAMDVPLGDRERRMMVVVSGEHREEAVFLMVLDG